MAIIILLVCFCAVFLTTGVLLSPSTGKKEVLICTVLIFSTLIAFITGLLSAFNQLDYTFIFTAWGLIALLNMVYLYAKKTSVIAFISSIKQRVIIAYTGISRFERFLLYGAFVLIALIFLQGIVYPPNNWDSMVYHLARVTSWVGNKSTAYYPTPVLYQLYQPPFAEYAILHFNILSGSDIFSNSVQFLFFLFSLVVTVAFIKNLGLSRPYQIMGIILAATIPEVVLQASSTQNDVVVCFFILAAYYFIFRIIKKEFALKNFFFLGLATGLAFFTKATAYIYLAPALPILSIYILITVFKTKKLRLLWYCIIAVVVTGSINAVHYYRNYQLSNDILGARKSDLNSFSNEKISPMLLLSSIEKNAGLQIGVLGSVKPAEFANKVIYKLNRIEGVNINDAANNFAGAIYGVPVGKANHEDYAANLFHFILIIAAFILTGIYAIKNKQSVLIKLLLLAVFLQVMLFCGYLKWQPWGTRLQVTIFMMAVGIVCYAASINTLFKKILNPVMVVSLLYALLLVARNATRPFLSAEIKDNRYEKYFENRPYLYNEYQQTLANIHRLNYKSIGLVMGANDWEYPLFAGCFSEKLEPVYVNVKNNSGAIRNEITAVDCIVTTTLNQPFIDYKGKRFYNQDSKNSYLHFYRQH
jgi:4-amino-4-deoxy-L-arabinose transferase-like glycosyltransferase